MKEEEVKRRKKRGVKIHAVAFACPYNVYKFTGV